MAGWRRLARTIQSVHSFDHSCGDRRLHVPPYSVELLSRCWVWSEKTFRRNAHAVKKQTKHVHKISFRWASVAVVNEISAATWIDGNCSGSFAPAQRCANFAAISLRSDSFQGREASFIPSAQHRLLYSQKWPLTFKRWNKELRWRKSFGPKHSTATLKAHTRIFMLSHLCLCSLILLLVVCDFFLCTCCACEIRPSSPRPWQLRNISKKQLRHIHRCPKKALPVNVKSHPLEMFPSCRFPGVGVLIRRRWSVKALNQQAGSIHFQRGFLFVLNGWLDSRR